MLDGVHLETLAVEDVDGSSGQSLTVLAAVALTLVDPSEADTQQAKLVIAPELPVVVMLDCGGGGSILASEGLLTVRGAVELDWRALECLRANGLDNGAKLLRVTTGSQECLTMLREVRPDVVVDDACRRFERYGRRREYPERVAQPKMSSPQTREFIYSNFWAAFCERRNGTTIFTPLGTRVIHRGQNGNTGEPSRDSVEEETDIRGRNQGWPCHKREISRLEAEIGEGKATSSGTRGISGTKRGMLPEER